MAICYRISVCVLELWIYFFNSNEVIFEVLILFSCDNS